MKDSSDRLARASASRGHLGHERLRQQLRGEQAKQDHPAQKRVVLCETPIAKRTKRVEAVYEPFVGSGTSIVVAERLGRRCYAMEIDPRYVQVRIERWQAFTGQEAARG